MGVWDALEVEIAVGGVMLTGLRVEHHHSDHSMSGRAAYRELFEFLNEFLEDKWYGRRKQ